ncbi:hypothetical protein AG1IA_03481 [Rhizoctonia solani AG-1 IA]|uniref:Uncharacterized protein n=1 Tax=Thanatephorus cucumeris (strain AG1-IA) TaxID=983506 RepID=L8WWJ7_THACA|nr:hypothetical protein AG1IA_03481 [Rhizoctonia solani AG-1 IA]
MSTPPTPPPIRHTLTPLLGRFGSEGTQHRGCGHYVLHWVSAIYGVTLDCEDPKCNKSSKHPDDCKTHNTCSTEYGPDIQNHVNGAGLIGIQAKELDDTEWLNKYRPTTPDTNPSTFFSAVFSTHNIYSCMA